VTRPRPILGKLFAHFVAIAQMKLYTKSEISSFTGTRFSDMFEGMPNLSMVTRI